MDRIPEFSIDAISQMSSRHQFSTPPSSLGGQGTTTSAPFSQHQETTEGPTYNPNFWNPVFRRLNETLISNVLPMDRKVVSVAPNASITDALAVLSQAHIHAAPIINSDDDSFHGVVTTTELMRFVYFANYSCMQRKESSPFGYRGPQTALPEGVSVNLAAVAGKTLADLDALPYTLQGSPAQPLRTLNLEDSMGKAARLILKGHKIIPVRNSHNGKIVNVVSVSDVLAYIARHKRAPSDRMYGLVESLEVEASDFPDVVTCCTDASVFEALRLLFISGQASVAMIDPHSGTIQGNFSSSDLARVCSENKHATLDLAGLDLKAFLSKYSPSSLRPVITFENAFLSEVLELIIDEKVSQVYSVGFKQRPRQSINATDVLKVLKGIHLLKPSTFMQPATTMNTTTARTVKWSEGNKDFCVTGQSVPLPIATQSRGHGTLVPSQAEQLVVGEYLKLQSPSEYSVYTRLPADTRDVAVRRDDASHTLAISIHTSQEIVSRELPIPLAFQAKNAISGAKSPHTSAHVVHSGSQKLLHILLEANSTNRFAPPCMPVSNTSHEASGFRLINITE